MRGALSGGTLRNESDLGTEPPLYVGETEDEPHVPRSVSGRWLAGTVLTGFTSVFLMGGALMAALSSPNQFADLPDTAFAATSDGPPGIAFGRKGDRMTPLQEEVSSRQILQVSTVTKQGERDFIKLRPFAKIAATLSARESEYDDLVPAYDALRIFADTSAPEPPVTGDAIAETDDQFYGAEVDGEVSVRVTDFPVGSADIDATAAPPREDAEAMVLAALEYGDGSTQMAALPYVDATGDVEGFIDDDPFAAVGVTIVPENVLEVAKTSDALDAEERMVTVAEGQSFRDLLDDNDVSEGDAEAIVMALAELVDLNALRAGQKVRLAYATDIDDSEPRPIRVSMYDDGAHQASVARTDDDDFRRTDEPRLQSEMLAEVEAQTFGTMPRVYDALYRTALEQEVPQPLIDQLVRIFAFDVDFQARISPGDTLEVFHSLPEDGPDISEPEILYASLTLNGTKRRFYRFRTPDDGVVDYYDAEGKSAKKFLMRKPITAGVLRSRFGMRRHPILGYRRMHAGVDYAAPRMTPILAAGNGVVKKAGRHSGYGNLITLQHTNGYETVYAHQTKFADGVRSGARVRQGQIIGYVGSTGLSTGPHLHFEIRVNGKPVDPLRIRLPRGRVLDTELLTAFDRERTRIDELLGNAIEPTQVVSTN
ncbi:M23 family metallopeptidase [Bauldia sp.]|uniref:M23 family metallopeptidase n=1 Tax=Bauldia sp. TaxID=2575872 RepID=UPI003BAA2D49